MSTDETELKTLLVSSTPEKNLNSIEQITETQVQLSKVKESLGSIIDSMAENQSIFSRAATYWGDLPLWQKIGGGIALSLPTLAIGIAANIGVLLAISGVTVVTYAASGIVLDDHHHCNVNIAERLRKGIFSLADVLEITIAALDAIRLKFTEEVDKFRLENDKLSNNVTSLGEEVDKLTEQVVCLAATEKLLRTSKEDLEKTAVSLKESAQGQQALLEANQQQLSTVTKQYEVSQVNLSEKILELNKVRTEMGLEVDKVRKMGATMKGAVDTLSGTVLEDKQQRATFQKRLDDFLKNQEVSFDKVADRICEAERELVVVKNELKESSAKYQDLLQRHEKQVERLEQLKPKVTSDLISDKQMIADWMSSNQSFFYNPTMPSTTEKTMPLLLVTTDSTQAQRI